ncbi:MAG: DUF6599 family protein [Desulfamplus sp.]
MFNSNLKSSFVGIAVIVVLIAIAAVIFNQQFSFNPAVTALSKKVVLPERDDIKEYDSEKQSDLNIGSSSEDSKEYSKNLKPIVRIPKALMPLSDSESFNSETLSDKINGKAELYLPAGFKSLVCQRFKINPNSDSGKSAEISQSSYSDSDKSPKISKSSSNLDKSSQTASFSDNLWIEVFVYDMTLPENAFAVFSRQRRENAVQISIADYAYHTENALFFLHGHFYIEMIASEPSQNGVNLMTQIGESFIEDRPALASKKMEVPDLFPVKGLDKESITLISSDAFGFDRFDNIYTAGYTLKGSEINQNSLIANKADINSSNTQTTITAFISKRDSSEEAARLALEYSEFLVNFGGNKINSAIEGVYAVEIMDTIEIIFSSGQYTAGVRESESLEISQHLAREIQTKIVGLTK